MLIKREKFERLAEKRVTEARRVLRLIGNLSNRRNYDYTDVHVKQIVDTLEFEFRQLKGRFKDEAQKGDVSFSFKDIDSGEDLSR